ncbi:hypothetical protein M011DRAFT_455595 [Sporormia fimetaria CBS 119925]|uniref:Uncharacterized protein n=1 Tax=Sporormia fimetaria CBS 119925 TaxID=1340428 RepID=A0A6A6VL88_9PLEO|nr:hypothetical protein M011DRAFT_455595 [Sporormia fimetaria CBS 119925]
MAVDNSIPPPDPHSLLPPLLACLTTSSTSKTPPAELLPLLSPILRQRVQLLASDEWLSLLCWDRDIASRLPQLLSSLHVEPHPVSSEIEIDDPEKILYRRSDPETLHSRIVLREPGIIPTYLWCTGGDKGDAWKLAEVRGVQDEDDGTFWFNSIAEADEGGFKRRPSIQPAPAIQPPTTTVTQPAEAPEDEDEDDGSYWAAYDRTPGRTPQQKHSPAPMTNSRVQVGPTQTEMDYFARYVDVQPALDAHDPDEEQPSAVESTLLGNTLLTTRPDPTIEPANPTLSPAATNGSTANGHTSPPETSSNSHYDFEALNHPRPSSPSSSSSIERLEQQAESSSQAELAVKQHVSHELKSLFRLARAAGIEREEFERIVSRELEVLPLLERGMEGS